MPKIVVNHLGIYYEEHGNKNAEPLLLIPGLGLSHTFWAPIVKSLAASYRVILLDNRGSGQSDVPNVSYTAETIIKCSEIFRVGVYRRSLKYGYDKRVWR